MAIDLATGFNIGSKDAIDERQVLTLEQMKNLDENVYPDNYFAICKDDGKLYIFNASNEINAETGKFRKVSSNESVDPSIFQKINDDTLITEDKTIVGAINELKTNMSNINTGDGKIINDENVATDKTYSSFKIEERFDELFQSVSNGKQLVASAITDKGVDTLADATFETMAENISNIAAGDLSAIYSALNTHGLSTSGKEDEEKIANIIQDLLTLAYLSQDTGIVEDFTDSTDNTIHENAFVEGTIGEIPIEPKELLFVNNTDYIEFEEITKSEYVTSILLNGRWL